MKFLPTTIEGWNAKKRLFMRLLTKEPNPEQAEVYENAIGYCDRKVGQVDKMRRRLFLMVILVNALVLLSILSGCNTIEGARQDIHQWTDTPAHHK
jgi:predicted small secreted protein